jgi:peptidyl-prolyl cis-trans isomerase C
VLRVLPLIVLLLVSCSRDSQTAAASQETAATPAGQTAAPAAAEITPVPAQLPEVVARVNGQAIDKAEFEKAVQTLESQNGGPVPPDQRDRILRTVLDQIIGYTLLVQESQARKVTVADAEIDARIGQIRSQFPTEEAFTQALAQQNVTVDQLRADARSEMLVTKMLEAEIEPKVAVTPADLQDFYTKNPDQFKQNERVRASHILIGFPQGADAAAKQAARTKAEGVLAEVKAGKDFAELARANSSDPGSAQQGGDLNFFERGQMVGPFDQAVFSMAPGQTSELVETQFGFHIIKVTDKQAARSMPLDEVRPQLTEFLQNQKRQEATQAFVESLKAKGKIEILI